MPGRPSRTHVVAAAGGVAAALVLAWLGWYVFGQSEPKPWNRPAEVEGDVVHLTYTGSRCRDGARVDVEEDSARVVLTVHETVRARACTDVGIRYEIDAELASPLGDRELVDGACETKKWAGSPGCTTRTPTR